MFKFKFWANVVLLDDEMDGEGEEGDTDDEGIGEDHDHVGHINEDHVGNINARKSKSISQYSHSVVTK